MDQSRRKSPFGWDQLENQWQAVAEPVKLLYRKLARGGRDKIASDRGARAGDRGNTAKQVPSDGAKVADPTSP